MPRPAYRALRTPFTTTGDRSIPSTTMITLVGINPRTAPVELREKLAWPDREVPQVISRVLEQGGSGAVLLSTCNRIELYLADANARALDEFWQLADRQLGQPAEPVAYVRQNREAARQLFRVAAGLDSMVLGESQIQAQVRHAWETCRDHAGPVLSRLFQTALRVGGRVRAETALGSGAASVPSASVDLARKIFGNLAGRRALILGAGDMAEVAMTCLSEEGVRAVMVAHKNMARARAIAEQWGGRAIQHDAAWEYFGSVDIVLCSTAAPHPVVRPERVRPHLRDRGGRPLCILDIAVPRDVDPAVGNLENVFLYDIDDLEGVVAASIGSRKREVPKAEAIVDQEVEIFYEWYRGRGMVDLVRALRSHAEEIRDRELARTMKKLGHLSDEDRERVEYLAKSLTNKLLHEPTVRLRGAAGNGNEAQVSATIRYLFDLREDVEEDVDSDR
ncbi:MAG: glutamyl-tRNA reductase [Gemmatimonadales bacterium]